MCNQNFVCGVGLGMVAGAAVAMTMMPKRKSVKKAAEKAMRTMGEAVENFTEALNL